MTAEPRSFKPLRIAVLTVSDTRDETTDKSGALLVERARTAGHTVAEKAIVRDDVYAIRAIVSAWIADDNVEVVISTGGTGITGRDGTPEAMRCCSTRRSTASASCSAPSPTKRSARRACSPAVVAGVANATYIFCLPGSSNACATGWDKLIAPQLDFRTRPCNLAELMPRLKE